MAWALFGSTVRSIAIDGVLIKPGGRHEVVSTEPGHLMKFLVAPGDRIEVGDPIARQSVPELERETAALRSRVELLETEIRLAGGNASALHSLLASTQVALLQMEARRSARELIVSHARGEVMALLLAIEEDFTSQRTQRGGGGVAVAVLGDTASGEAALGTELDIMFVYGGGPVKYYETLCRRFLEGLCMLSHNNLLFAPIPRGREERAVRSLTDFEAHHQNTGSASELLDLARARCVFTSGDSRIGERFDKARREILTHGIARSVLTDELREAAGGTVEPDLLSINNMRGGLRDVERTARLVQLTHAEDTPDILVPDASSRLPVCTD